MVDWSVFVHDGSDELDYKVGERLTWLCLSVGTYEGVMGARERVKGEVEEFKGRWHKANRKAQ